MDATSVFVSLAIGKAKHSMDSAMPAAYPRHLTSSRANQYSEPARRVTAGHRSAKPSALPNKPPGNGTQEKTARHNQSRMLRCRIGLDDSGAHRSMRKRFGGVSRLRPGFLFGLDSGPLCPQRRVVGPHEHDPDPRRGLLSGLSPLWGLSACSTPAGHLLVPSQARDGRGCRRRDPTPPEQQLVNHSDHFHPPRVRLRMRPTPAPQTTRSSWSYGLCPRRQQH